MAQKYKVEIDRELCIGDQLCCDEAPNTFEMDDEDKAVVMSEDADTSDCVRCAAENCPTDAIILRDSETGEQIWPEE